MPWPCYSICSYTNTWLLNELSCSLGIYILVVLLYGFSWDVITCNFTIAFICELSPSFRSSPLYYSLHYTYHPELLLGSRGRFPDVGRRDEAKHTLTSKAKTSILKTKRFALSIFAILSSSRNLCFAVSPGIFAPRINVKRYRILVASK